MLCDLGTPQEGVCVSQHHVLFITLNGYVLKLYGILRGIACPSELILSQ